MPAQFTFEVTGMTCAGCAGRAERALNSLDGLDTASINLTKSTATVESNAATARDIQQQLTSAGYPAREQKITLIVDNMTCASCTDRIETTLRHVPGVLKAQANLTRGIVVVSQLAGSNTPDALASKVASTGYRARPQTDETQETDSHDQTVKKTKKAAIISALLTAPVFFTEMGGHIFPPLHHAIIGSIGQQSWWIMQFLLTTLVLAWPGRSFFTRGIPLLLRRTPDMNSLVALGAGAAWAFSTLVLFAPQLLPTASRLVYFEAAAVIITLILVGRWLEARAKGQAGAAIRALVGYQARNARVQRDGTFQDIPISDVMVGDILQVKPGERIAVDGIVVSGTSYVDVSMITGEPIPALKEKDREVIAGTVNGNGVLTYAATRVGADTMLSRIITLVEQAQGAKLPVQALADRVVMWFVPAVLGIALLTIATWLFFGPTLAQAMVAGVSVLIIACPCAMGLATPTSIMVGTGRAAELGVLFRKGDALQRLENVKAIAFDKTGTLTMGTPRLVTIEPAKGFSKDHLLASLASAELASEHPIAQAIIDAAKQAELSIQSPDDFTAIPGFGLNCRIGDENWLVGAARLMHREGVDITSFNSQAQELAKRGETPLFAAMNGQVAGLVGVADPLKPEAAEVINALHASGMEIAIITGDAQATAESVAQQLGIRNVQAELLPSQKSDAIEKLRAQYGSVTFVGDGINDAPALAHADVGIAIGSGTDVAIESADIVLTGKGLGTVPTALSLSRNVMRNIRQNLFWTFAYNILLIPVAAGVFYPMLGLTLSPMLGAGAMALSSVFVLGNALRLRALQPATCGALK